MLVIEIIYRFSELFHLFEEDKLNFILNLEFHVIYRNFV